MFLYHSFTLFCRSEKGAYLQNYINEHISYCPDSILFNHLGVWIQLKTIRNIYFQIMKSVTYGKQLVIV